ARQTLETILAEVSDAVPPRVILSHVLLQEGRDEAAAEQALRAVLERDPQQGESWRNLVVLLRRQGRRREAESICRLGRGHNRDDAGLLLLDGILLRELGNLPEAERCLLHCLVKSRPAPTQGVANPHCTARHQLALLYQSQ